MGADDYWEMCVPVLNVVVIKLIISFEGFELEANSDIDSTFLQHVVVTF